MGYVSLDALRGIASLMVVTHHCVLAGLIRIPPGGWTTATRYTPLHLFVSGRPPVILFFVLSGFALAVSLEKKPRSATGGSRCGGCAGSICRTSRSS